MATKQILPKLLERRISLMIEACSPVTASKYRWWAKYKHKEGLEVRRWGDTWINYRRDVGHAPYAVVSNIQPKTLTDVKESVPIKIGSKVIDAAGIKVLNAYGQTSRPWTYTGEFEKTTSKREAFEMGFSQSIRNCFTAGNDATPVKNELEITLGFNQSSVEESSESERQNRIFSFSGDTPVGIDELITARREVSRMKSTLTGKGDYEFSLKFGNHWSGKWNGGTRQWDSFEDFMRVIKGNAPSSWSLADAFRKYSPPSWLIEELEKPLNLPFIQTLEFDQATSVELVPIPL